MKEDEIKLFDPKKGDKVAVCYDGKLSRAVEGVVKKRRGFALLVEFKEWASRPNDNTVQNWFVRLSPYSFSGYLRVDDSLMKMMVGTPGDWYSVFSGEYLMGEGAG